MVELDMVSDEDTVAARRGGREEPKLVAERDTRDVYSSNVQRKRTDQL